MSRRPEDLIAMLEHVNADTKRQIEELTELFETEDDPIEKRKMLLRLSKLQHAVPETESLIAATRHQIYRGGQRQKSKGPRRAGDDGQTWKDLVTDEDAKDQWPHFRDVLRDWCGEEPELSIDAKGREFYQYDLVRESKPTLKQKISYRTFREEVARRR